MTPISSSCAGVRCSQACASADLPAAINALTAAIRLDPKFASA
jgi:hypothetical protein